MKYEELRLFAYSNDRLIKGKIRGIVIGFTGLNGTRMLDDDPEDGLFYAEKNIVYVWPYVNPWCWMNMTSAKLTDSVLDCLFGHYGLDESTPVIATGGSMGGQCALVFSYYSHHTPSACAAICPVCDLPYHYTERPDVPRTLVSAFSDYDIPLEVSLKTASPYHLAPDMPDIDYFIVHCEKDTAVSKQMHSDRFVERLREDHRVTYVTVPDRDHCDITPEVKDACRAFIVEHCGA